MDERGRRATRAVAALEDEVRSRLNEFVRRQGRPVTREEAARATGISAKLAAFHLDKLVERGLLVYDYVRPPGREGPGAGRPPKVYEPAPAEFAVSVPERRYDLAGRLLLRALEERKPGEPARHAARRSARKEGEALGRSLRQELGLRRLGRKGALSAVEEVLSSCGYEAYRDGGQQVRLHNCPFQALASESQDLVCGMNHAFIEGMMRGLGSDALRVELDFPPEHCCVTLRLLREKPAAPTSAAPKTSRRKGRTYPSRPETTEGRQKGGSSYLPGKE